jgi:hypothetical protein
MSHQREPHDEPLTVEALFAEAHEHEQAAAYVRRHGLGADRPELVRLLDRADDALERGERGELIAALEAMRLLAEGDGQEDDDDA